MIIDETAWWIAPALLAAALLASVWLNLRNWTRRRRQRRDRPRTDSAPDNDRFHFLT